MFMTESSDQLGSLPSCGGITYVLHMNLGVVVVMFQASRKPLPPLSPSVTEGENIRTPRCWSMRMSGVSTS